MRTQKNLVLFIIVLICNVFTNPNVVSAPVKGSEAVLEQFEEKPPETTGETQSNRLERVKQSETSKVLVKIVIFFLAFVLGTFLFVYVRRLHYREKPGRRGF